jgi:hypothetical protein
LLGFAVLFRAKRKCFTAEAKHPYPRRKNWMPRFNDGQTSGGPGGCGGTPLFLITMAAIEDSDVRLL